jgi:hypothetical protein
MNKFIFYALGLHYLCPGKENSEFSRRI